MSTCFLTSECQFLNEDDELIGLGVCFEEKCVCPYQFGWQGETCSESSPQVVFIQAFSSLRIILRFALLIISGYTLTSVTDVVISYEETDATQRLLKSSKRNLGRIISLTALSQVFHLMGALVAILSVFDPTALELTENDAVVGVVGDDGFSVVGRSNFAFDLVTSLGNTLLLMASYVVVMAWVSMMRHTNDFEESSPILEGFLSFKAILAVIGTLSLGVFLMLHIIQDFILIANVYLFSTVILLMFMVVARHYYIRKLSPFVVEKGILKIVKKSAYFQIVGYVTGVLAAFVISVALTNSTGDDANIVVVLAASTVYELSTIFIAIANIEFCNSYVKYSEKSTDEVRIRESFMASPITAK